MTWTMTRTDLLTKAYKKAGLIARGQSPTAAQLADGADSLNAVLEELHNDGFHSVQIEKDTQALTASTATYTLDAGVEDLLAAYLNTGSNDDKPYLTINDVYSYNDIPNKESEGEPVSIYIDYQNPRTVTLWPVPNATDTLNMIVVKKITDLSTASSTLEYDKRAWNAIIYLTAADIADENNVKKGAYLRGVGEKKWAKARSKSFRSSSNVLSVGAY